VIPFTFSATVKAGLWHSQCLIKIYAWTEKQTVRKILTDKSAIYRFSPDAPDAIKIWRLVDQAWRSRIRRQARDGQQIEIIK
jgi:hypothetical protein